MTTSRRRRWGWIAGVAVFLPLAAGWNAPACGQGTGTTTFTTSTTASTTYAVPGGGTFTVAECPFTGSACPIGTTPQVNHTAVSVSTTTTTGPGTIFIGQCQSQPHVVPAGINNLNTNTHTQTFVDCLAAAPAAVPTLSPLAFVAIALFFGGLGAWHLSRRRKLT